MPLDAFTVLPNEFVMMRKTKFSDLFTFTMTRGMAAACF